MHVEKDIRQRLKIPKWLERADDNALLVSRPLAGDGGRRLVERNLGAVARFVKDAALGHEFAGSDGLMQGLIPPARLMGVALIIMAAALMHGLGPLLGVVLLTAVLARLSRVPVKSLAKRILPPVVFTSILVLPVVFGFFSPGTGVVGFSVGGIEISVTREGIATAALLVARVTAMVSMLALLFLTTGETELLRALKRLPVPEFVVTALFMTLRFVFVLLRMVEDTTLSRRSRTIAPMTLGRSGGWFASRVAFFFERTVKTAEALTEAMVARGFTGSVRHGASRGPKAGGREYLWIGFCSFIFFLSFGL